MRRVILVVLLLGGWAGCGTSKFTDTRRTATEQLLISDAMDRAVSQLDLRALAGKTVYLDTTPLKSATDAEYLTSTLRQHILASGCILKDKRDDADYIVEARAGSTGTDNHSMMFGVPQTNVPTTVFSPASLGLPASIPEIPLAKKMEQRAIIKIGLFAYNRKTGRPVWQSGLVTTESKAKHLWVFGAGPFQRGTIYEGTEFAGDQLKIPLIDLDRRRPDQEVVSVADEAYFMETQEKMEKTTPAERIALSEKKEKSSPAAPPGGAPQPASQPPSARPSPSPAANPTANPTPPPPPPPPPPSPPSAPGSAASPLKPPVVSPNAPLPSGNQPFFRPFEEQPLEGFPRR